MTQAIGQRAHCLEARVARVLVEHLRGDFADARGELGDAARGEVARDQLAQSGVYRRIRKRHRRRAAEGIGTLRHHLARNRAGEVRVIAQNLAHVRIAGDHHYRQADGEAVRRSGEQRRVMRIRVREEGGIERIVDDFGGHSGY